MSEVTVNIDTVEFSVSGDEGRFDIQGATRARLISADGEILDSYQNRVDVPGKYSAHSAKVRTMNSGRKLKVEGPLFASMHGQNVYTSHDMAGIVVSHLKSISRIFKLRPSNEEKEKWGDGDINLHRVDLAVNFRLESEAEVINVINQIKHQLVAQGRTVKVYATSVIWTPREGKDFSIGAYAKGPQMRRSKRFNCMSSGDKERLLAECEAILRVEIRLREAELRRLGLSKVRDWDEQSAQKVFSSYMKRLRFLNVTSGPFKEEEMEGLDGRLRAAFALHKLGANLSLVFTHRTLQRHLADFKKEGIDLRIPNQGEELVTPLTKVLSPKRAVNEPPEWMLEAGLIPE